MLASRTHGLALPSMTDGRQLLMIDAPDLVAEPTEFYDAQKFKRVGERYGKEHQ